MLVQWELEGQLWLKHVLGMFYYPLQEQLLRFQAQGPAACNSTCCVISSLFSSCLLQTPRTAALLCFNFSAVKPHHSWAGLSAPRGDALDAHPVLHLRAAPPASPLISLKLWFQQLGICHFFCCCCCYCWFSASPLILIIKVTALELVCQNSMI